MSETRQPTSWFTPQLILAYVSMAGTAFLAYDNFKDDTSLSVYQHEQRIAALEKDHAYRDQKLSGRYFFMRDMAQMIEYICSKTEGCQSRHPPIKVPE